MGKLAAMQALPENFNAARDLSWPTYAPAFDALLDTDLNGENVNAWLAEWTKIENQISDLLSRIYVAMTANTADEVATSAYSTFYKQIFPEQQRASQALKEKLLASGVTPANFEIPLRNMRCEAAIFRAENVELKAKESEKSTEYGEIVGAQTVRWEGEEITLTKLEMNQLNSDREVRERAWRLGMDRRLEDRSKLNALWAELLDLRVPQAKNAGFETYTQLRWQEMQRFDYTEADCESFRDAIEKSVVPAAKRIIERRRARLGLDSVRPWDLGCPEHGQQPLKPFSQVADLEQKASAIFRQVDPVLGGYYDAMLAEDLLDLGNRKNKAPGGYCTAFPVSRRPFIYMNAVGKHGDVQTLLHEGGHAFHVFESAVLPYHQQHEVNTEFAEVASMSMELLAGPYLDESYGGYYSAEDAKRARKEHLEKLVLFWPYMAVVDGFQHWVYADPQRARDSAQCDRAWSELWDRFMGFEDWSGLQAEKETGWHRKLHIFEIPFYYVEYGLAQLGAVQVWRNSLEDAPKAIANYRSALALGGTVTLPQLFSAAGARFAFDVDTVQSAVDLIESKLA